ncbi:hypothetical protein AMS68_004357 [Peltaster fructicola]|uniref:Zn(2)-C6 fungal-type domain-containing protein n=1 Tax=Peltaster fructicola TaxID=286661 RepID=A0A6H0XWM6_9PEZI|nr:hypothetical protein AMS68_004357 [Peltaster fructicola]
MDSARTAPPRHPQPHPPSHHYQPQAYAAYPPAPITTHAVAAGQSQTAPSPIADTRHQQQQQYPAPPPSLPPQYPQPGPPPHAHNAAHPYHPSVAYSTALPPIHTYPPGPPQPAPAQFGQEPGLPSVRPQSGPQTQEGVREGHEQYSQHNRSGHATPAPIAQRSFTHDQQHTPLTPAQSGPHLPGPAPEPPQKPMEHVMHQGYPHHNGVHQVGPHPHHAPPHEQHGSYASTPVMDHNQYALQQQQIHYPQGYGPASQQQQQQQQQQPYATSAAVSKRKPMRAQQACEQCRQRKQKCDEGTPCSFCREQNIACTYRDTPPAKTDKNTEKIMTLLEQIMEKFDSVDSRLRRIETTQDVKQEINGTASPHVKAGSAPAQVQHLPPAQSQPEPELETHAKIAQPKNHRTPPHKLMSLWPTAAALFPPDNIPSEHYVAISEDRGILRLYGKGEGIDDQDGTQPGGPASPARSDDSSDNAPTPREGIWGRGFVNNTNVGSARPLSLVGGLKADGSLDLDSATIVSLFDSYMAHMHPMHPFLDRSRARKLIDTFISRYSPDFQGRRSTGFAVTAREQEVDRPLKRPRVMSPSANVQSGPPPFPPPPPVTEVRHPLITERSPANAIVWLILALGKICQHRTPLPGVIPDSKGNTSTAVAHQLTLHGHSPLNLAVKPSPPSPTSILGTHATPPEHGIARSRRGSHDGGNLALRNIESIPGLAYYAKAAEIMGDQGDGADLVHAQMFLLAALYKGQLARVRESMRWLTRAGTACQELIESHKLYKPIENDRVEMLRRIRQKTSDKRNYLIVMAAWSCLQLESDILAELHLPGSGISSLEDMLMSPGGVIDEDEPYKHSTRPGSKHDTYDDSVLMLHYNAQILLRRVLNGIHRELYGEEAKNKSIATLQSTLLSYETELAQWRSSLPKEHQWDDKDEPPTTILPARLRAKYYGAIYISTRPFLDYCLHIMAQHQQGAAVEDVALDARGNRREIADVMVLKAIAHMPLATIWEYAQRCVNAALRSTVALDGVPARLIITNIHGTAHAQFGNMLVLAAAFNTPHVKALVPQAEFEEKLERTIAFLRRLSGLSPTCQLDCFYLETIQTALFPVPVDAKGTYQSEKEPRSATTSFSYGPNT